jgi:hypothetical protein
VFLENKVIGSPDSLMSSILIREETDWTEYKIRTLQEEQKSVVVDNIVTKLFNDIKSKAISADFTEVDSTKGNIKKLKKHDALFNAINYLVKLSESNNEVKKISEELKFTYETIRKYNKEFEIGYKLNNVIIRYLYSSAVVGLIQGTAFAVAQSVEFVKDNLNLYKAQVKPSKALEKNNHIKALMLFNEMERKKQLVKFFKETQQFQEGLFGDIKGVFSDVSGRIKGLSGAGKFIAILGLIGFALTFIRALVFTYYNTRVKLSQYLKFLQEFVNMNVSTLDNDARKVKEKQEKIANILGKLADVINVDQNVSNDRAKSQIEQSNKIIALDNKSSNSGNVSDLDLY